MSASEATQQVNLPMVTRAVPVKSVDAEKRTVDVVFSTGAKVRRAKWVGWETRVPYDETIIVSDDAINMERLRAGGPVLDSHSTYTTRSQVAVVDKAWISGGEAWARVRFPSAGVDEAADRMWALVQEGIVRNVSVGYSQDEIRIVEADKKGDVEQWFVERWTPYEISFVTVNADAKAQVRSEEARFDGTRMHSAVIRSQHPPEGPMADTPAQPAPVPPVAPASETPVRAVTPIDPPDQAQAIRAAVEAERSRVSEINRIAQNHNLRAEIVERATSEGMTLDQFRALALEELSRTAPAARIRGGNAALTVLDPGVSPEMERSARVEGLVARMTGRMSDQVPERIRDQAREFASFSLLDHARDVLGLSPRALPIVVYDKIVERNMLGTTDYPNLLAAVANKILLQGYQYQPPTYQTFARKRNFNDFRVHNFLRLGDFPLPQYITETGEFKNGALSESKNTGQAGTAGIIVTLTRQMLINDDTNAFADLSRLAGQRMIDWENYTAWTYILQGAATTSCGPTLGDTGLLFNNTAVTTAGGHANNSTTGSAISAAPGGSLDLARQAMRQQKSLDGVPLNGANNPTILVVGPQKETEAQTVLSQQLLATQTSNVNVFMGKFNLVVDAYITDKSWFLFADPNGLTPVLQWGYVNGFEGPRFSIDTPFRQDGMSLKAVEDWGIAAVDFRGAYRNSGA